MFERGGVAAINNACRNAGEPHHNIIIARSSTIIICYNYNHAELMSEAQLGWR